MYILVILISKKYFEWIIICHSSYIIPINLYSYYADIVSQTITYS